MVLIVAMIIKMSIFKCTNYSSNDCKMNVKEESLAYSNGTNYSSNDCKISDKEESLAYSNGTNYSSNDCKISVKEESLAYSNVLIIVAMIVKSVLKKSH